MIPNFAERMASEIISLSTEEKRQQGNTSASLDVSKVRIIPDSQRKYASWIGGSMFGSLETFGQIQITKQEYEDQREAMILRKCF